MATVNERFRDAGISRAVDVRLYSNGVVRRMIALLHRVDAELAAELSRALQRLPADSFTVERLERLLGGVRELTRQIYAQVHADLQVEIRSLAQVEAPYQAELFRRVVPAEVQVRFPIVGIAFEQVYVAALSRPFQGRLLSGWAAQLEAGAMEVVRNTVRMGYIEGQTTQQIVRRLIGTRAKQYADGTLQRARREVTAVVHTALAHLSQTVRNEMQAANADILAATMWVSTLDARTSEMCRIRDRLKYTVIGHKPIGHNVQWLEGPGKIHWNCRSTSVPVLKSWRELGFDVGELPLGTRASMDGQVPADLTFGRWLSRQSAERQDQVMGKTRGRLMRAGKLKLPDFYDSQGRWLTLDQLKSREVAAFERAGI